MKRLIVFVSILSIFSVLTLAQERMSFKGISLNNSVEDFVKELEEKGFKKIDSEEMGVELQGLFLNQVCQVFVIGVPNSNAVLGVAVVLPEQNKWASLEDDYFTTKELYQQKYGKGESVEEFEGRFYNDSEGMEMMALAKDLCKYETEFETKRGSIYINITSMGHLSLKEAVMVGYTDKVNREINEQKNLEDI